MRARSLPNLSLSEAVLPTAVVEARVALAATPAAATSAAEVCILIPPSALVALAVAASAASPSAAAPAVPVAVVVVMPFPVVLLAVAVLVVAPVATAAAAAAAAFVVVLLVGQAPPLRRADRVPGLGLLDGRGLELLLELLELLLGGGDSRGGLLDGEGRFGQRRLSLVALGASFLLLRGSGFSSSISAAAAFLLFLGLLQLCLGLVEGGLGFFFREALLLVEAQVELFFLDVSLEDVFFLDAGALGEYGLAGLCGAEGVLLVYMVSGHVERGE